MVTVNAFGTTNVTVGVVHRNAPLLAVCILTAASAALGVLNGNVKAVNLNMSLLVVACLLLCISRVGFCSCLCCRNSGCKVVLLAVAVVLVENVKNGTHHVLITTTFSNETLLLSELCQEWLQGVILTIELLGFVILACRCTCRLCCWCLCFLGRDVVFLAKVVMQLLYNGKTLVCNVMCAIDACLSMFNGFLVLAL